MKSATKTIVILLSLTLLLASCGSKKKKGSEGGSTTPETSSVNAEQAALADKYFGQIISNNTDAKNIVAKVHVALDINGESLSTSGTLRMRKDDVIQLSLVDPILGIMELGRLEFTENKVLMIIRVKKEYVEVPYSKVDFLKQANVNFNTLQSLFWNELFEPGYFKPDAKSFTYSLNANKVNLQIIDGILEYDFQTAEKNGLLSKTEITGSKDKTYRLWFDYAKFNTFEKKPFPHDITLSFSDGSKKTSLHLELSSLKNSADWETRTSVPSGYDKANFETLFKMLVK